MSPRASARGCSHHPLAFVIPYAVLLILATGRTVAGAAEIRFIPAISLREEFNDNIFFESSDETRDRITTVSPGASITDRTEKINALLQSRFSIIRYARSDDLDTTDQDHVGRLGCLFSERLKFSAEAGMTRDSRADRDVEATGLILGTARRDRTRYALSADYSLSEKAGATLVYAYNHERFNSDDFEDSTTQDAGMGFRYDLSSFVPRAFARANVGYGLYDFTDTRVVNHALTVGMGKQLSETFTLSADIGRSLTRTSSEYMFWIFTIEERSVQRGTIGDLTLAYTGEQASGSIALLRDVRALSGRTGTSRRTALKVDISRRFTSDLTGNISAEYCLNKTGSEQTSGTEIDDRALRIQPLLIIQVTNDLTLNASCRFMKVRDYVLDQRSTQSIYFIGLAWQYPVPRQ